MDSRLLISGSADGTLKFWDLKQQQLTKSVKVGTSEASYPLCLAINKGSVNEGFAVGLLNKTVKFFTIDSNQSNNPMNWEYS
jgi:WD40 repeat protein